MAGRDIDFDGLRALLKELEEKRNRLKGVEDTRISKIVRAVEIVGGAVSSVVSGLSKVTLTTTSDKLQLLSEDTSFMTACKIIVKNLEYFSKVYEDDSEKFKSFLLQFNKLEVIISFYGDSNAGKSTLLNCILGDRYLPSKKISETAASVHIQLLEGSTQAKPEDSWGDNADGILCTWNGKETVLAKGQKNISETLTIINKQTREAKSVGKPISSTYILKLKHPLGMTTTENTKFLLFDNPGCDEYGSETITSSIEMAKLVSSAFIFVTTIEGYTKLGSSGMLMSLYAENPGILKDDRLTIIINKMDLALGKTGDEEEMSKEEIIRDARNFFCNTVFKCKNEDLPSHSIILVCGQWALMSRSYRKTKEEKFIASLKSYSVILKTINEFSEKKELQHLDEEKPLQQALILEDYSNIMQLEERLKIMTEKSTLLWKKKIREDLNTHLTVFSRMLNMYRKSENQDIAGLTQKTEPLFNAISRVHSFYFKIMDNRKMCKEKQLPPENTPILEFREAFEKDMQTELNLQTQLQKDVEVKLNSFKMSTSEKINKKTHTSAILIEDLRRLVNDVSKSINQYVALLENLTAAFQAANSDIFAGTVELNTILSAALNLQTSDQEVQGMGVSPSHAAFPKLTDLGTEISLNIPLQLSSWQQFVKFMRKVLRMPTDMYQQPLFEVHNKPDVEAKFSFETSSIFLSFSKYDADPTEQETCTELVGNTVETCYTKWTQDLENMITTLREDFHKDIAAFFENADDNIIQKCCEQHYEVALHMLKDFDESASDKIEKCKCLLESIMNNVDTKQETLKQMIFHHEKLESMKTVFEHISQIEFSATK